MSGRRFYEQRNFGPTLETPTLRIVGQSLSASERAARRLRFWRAYGLVLTGILLVRTLLGLAG